MIARGHELRLVTSHRGRPSRIDEDGLEVIRQWRPPERPFNALGLPPGTSHALPAWLALRRSNADIVQGWTAPAALAAAHSGKPSIFVFQGVLHEDDVARRPRTRALLMRAARDCDVVTAYSDVAAREFEWITGIEARPIEPGIRLDAFAPAPDSPRHESPAIFCAADPDEPRKRVRLLVQAFDEVRRARPDAELWLMPAADPALKSAPGVRIVDPGADREALVGLYRAAWVTVLPAFREAFGLVVVESLACGTPVVGMSDGGAVAQLVGDDGWIAEPDAASLARTLLAALEGPADPHACRQLAEQYSIERCAERYESLYRELLAP